jgi:hypothetical protein
MAYLTGRGVGDGITRKPGRPIYITYLDAPVYMWGVQVNMAYLTGRGSTGAGAAYLHTAGDLLHVPV